METKYRLIIIFSAFIGVFWQFYQGRVTMALIGSLVLVGLLAIFWLDEDLEEAKTMDKEFQKNFKQRLKYKNY